MERPCYEARCDALGRGRHTRSCQEWISQRVEMAAAGAQRLSDEGGTIMQRSIGLTNG